MEEWYEILDSIYVGRSTGWIISKLVKEKYKPFLIPQDIVYICLNVNDCQINTNNIVAMIHFEKSWDNFRYTYLFLFLYKWVLTIAAIVMIYLYYMKCKQLYDICEYKKLLLSLIILSFIYNTILYKRDTKMCINGFVGIFIFLTIYINLHFKCNQCIIKL